MRLTKRQSEVAELIARGLTNREIAKALFISERTVEGHVEQVLNVLGLSSRTQVAAWFVQRELGLQPHGQGRSSAGPHSAAGTLLMADLVGSSDSPDAPETLPQRRFVELFASRTQRHGGVATQLAGPPGRRLAIFTDAPAAVACAHDLHYSVATALWAPGTASVIRVALHEAPQGPEGDGPAARAIAACGWLLELGGPGQTLIAESARAGLDAALEAQRGLRLAGRYPLAESAEPVDVYEIVDPKQTSPTRRSRPTNLPVPLTSFVDRRIEIAELRDLLDRNRLLTLVGPGGVGKTRLALQLVDEVLETFADGALLVELARVADDRLVPQSVAGMLRLPEVPGTLLLDTLIEHLAERRLLLILDNCEHVLLACAELVETLLRSCPSLVALVTSREPLGVPGEQIYRVSPLTHPEPDETAVANVGRYPAMRLFVDRARLNQPTFSLTTRNARAVARITSQLEGMPLAIELAATWIDTLDVDELLARLEDRLGLLTRGPSMAPTRHQTLSAAIDWSDRLLSERERRLFHRLSVFVSGFGLPDVEAVCADDIDSSSLPLLSRLVRKSLVSNERDRYRCLETIRAYARSRLRSDGELERIEARHARHFAAVVASREPGLTAAWVQRLEEALPDIRAALQWAISADIELALTMVDDLLSFWLYAGHLAEARQWSREVVLAAGDEPATRARALAASALAAYSQGDGSAGMVEAEEAAALAGQSGDDRTLADARRVQGLMAISAENLALAEAFCGEALALYLRLGDRAGEMNARYSLGLVAGSRGDLDRARSMFEGSLELRTQLGRRDDGSATLAFVGLLALIAGDRAGARASIHESAWAASRMRDRRAAWTLDVAACLAAGEGERERALTLAGAAHEMHRASGVRPPAVWDRFVSTWLEPARDALGPEVAAAAWSAGAGLTFDAALDSVLGGTHPVP